MGESVKDRIRIYLDKKNIRPTAFCRAIGVSDGFISGMRKSMQPDKLYSIATSYPDLNIGWLLTGVGDMEIDGKSNEKNGREIEEVKHDAVDDDSLSGCSLYHYTTADNLLKIIENMSLRYSSFLTSFDPKERKMYLRMRGTTEKQKKAFRAQKYDKYLSFCIGRESGVSYGDHEATILPRMWAQYGTMQDKNNASRDSFMNGACIEFYPEELHKKAATMNEISFIRIEYRKENSFKAQDATIEEDMKFKYIDWQGEREYRAIYRGDDEYFDISGCVRKVWLGEDFSHENVNKLCEIMALKRYEDIDPNIFNRVNVWKGGIMRMHSTPNFVLSCMMSYLHEKSPEYAQEVEKKYNMGDFKKAIWREVIKKEQKDRDDIDAKYWMNKYLKIVEEKDSLYKETMQALKEKEILYQKFMQESQENKAMNKKLLASMAEFHDLLLEHDDDLNTIKNEIVERVSAVRAVLEPAG